MTDQIVLISADEERALIIEVLTRLGAGLLQAQDQAKVLVEGDLRGRPSHGIQRLPVLVARIRGGLLRPAASGSMTWTAEAMLSVDGEYGFGPHVAFRAAEAIAERASRTGVAAAAIHHAGHLGMLAPYVEMLAERKMVALAFSSTEALVHPWGGLEALVGTNPIALAVPTATDPFVLDMATGAISKGEVMARLARGEPLPANAAVDAHGNPTTDPAAAETGAISPFGGPKGFVLGLGIGLLVASLTGTALGDEVRGTLDATDPITKGDLLIAFDATVVGAEVESRIDDYLEVLRRSPAAPGSAGVVIPGTRSRLERERRVAEGIPVPSVLWRELQALREDLPFNG